MIRSSVGVVPEHSSTHLARHLVALSRRAWICPKDLAEKATTAVVHRIGRRAYAAWKWPLTVVDNGYMK